MKKNYVLVTIVYLSINIYFHQYIPICIYLIFFSDNLRIKKYWKDKRQNDANLMYHYKNNKYLNIIFIFTHIIYGLAFINFICQGLPIFQKYSVHIFDTIIFTLVIDFLAVLLSSYAAYSNANPTQPFSNLFSFAWSMRIWGVRCST